MKYKEYDYLNGASRSNQRAKRRKTNLILNSLIVIVLLLIIFVSYNIFFGGGEQTSQPASNQKTESNENDNKGASDKETSEESDSDSDSTNTENETGTETDSSNETDELGTEEDLPAEQDSDTVTTEGGSDSNVKGTIVNPNWQPIGTTQTGEHVPNYDETSTDWREMLLALSYGTGLNPNEMTVWFLGRNKEGAGSVATVSTKDNSQNYRVYIEWVNGEGWKPVKIEELHQNDKR